MTTLLLTGASGDIGAAIAAKFSQHGYTILAPSRTAMDLADTYSINCYLQHLTQSVDTFVHCAGINQPKALAELTPDDCQHSLQINTLSFFTIATHLARHLMQHKLGNIIAISSIYGTISRTRRLAYSASKAALNAMVKTLALELGVHQIKVNGVAPGFVETAMTSRNNSQAIIDNLISQVPLGRLATSNDIAKVVYFLCSPDNSYINGQIITVDGGYSIGGFQPC